MSEITTDPDARAIGIGRHNKSRQYREREKIIKIIIDVRSNNGRISSDGQLTADCQSVKTPGEVS